MRVMTLSEPGTRLAPEIRARPEPAAGQVLVKVGACGVCRTDLHVIDGELTEGKLPIVPGHEVVGTVAALGEGVDEFGEGERVGIPWLGHSCGQCRFCLRGQENLCAEARFTGYHLDGGYADYALADHRYCFPVHGDYSDAEAAPLMCAGVIGYRSLRMAGDAERIGLYGFGAAAHIVAQLCQYEGRRVFAFTRLGDTAAQDFARGLGAVWASGSAETPPEPLDAAIIFAPVGALVPAALRAIDKGGTVICGGIHMSDIPSFPYEILWHERTVRSVANLTRRDVREFLELAPRAGIRTHVKCWPLAEANEAIDALRGGRLEGAAVLLPEHAG